MNFTFRPTPISLKTALSAVFFGLVVGVVLILATGNNPIEIYQALLRGACGSRFALCSSIRWTVPLLFSGTAAALAFKGGVFNMGIEGQMYMGGFAAVVVGLTFPELPKVVLLPTMLAASMLAGMIWALPPMLAKVYYGRSEVVPCMMLNYIAIYLTDFFVHNFFLASGNRGATIKTDIIPDAGKFTKLIKGTSVTTTVFVGLFVVALFYLIIKKTRFGYELEMCGINPRFAKYGGINVHIVSFCTILLSGALAGLGGATEVMGVRMCFESKFVNDFATNGILAALLGSCSPIGTMVGALFMGFLKAGALTVERTTSVSRAVVVVIQCTIICFVSAKSFASIFGKRKDKAEHKTMGGEKA